MKKPNARKNSLQEIRNLACVLADLLPESIEKFRHHRDFAKALRGGEIVEKDEHHIRRFGRDDVAQRNTWRDVMAGCVRDMDALARLLITHLPETAKRCPLIEVATLRGAAYTRPEFDATEFRRQCRDIDIDAYHAILSEAEPAPKPKRKHIPDTALIAAIAGAKKQNPDITQEAFAKSIGMGVRTFKTRLEQSRPVRAAWSAYKPANAAETRDRRIRHLSE